MNRNSASYLFTLLLLLSSHFSFAQSKLTVGKHKLKHTVFNINKLENTLVVLEENGMIKLGQKSDYSLWYPLDNIVYTNKEDVKSAFVKVFGSKRISELPPKERVTINVILNKQGKSSEVTYYLSENSGLTLEELDRLSAYIKDHIVVNMTDVPLNKLTAFKNVILFDRIGK